MPLTGILRNLPFGSFIWSMLKNVLPPQIRYDSYIVNYKTVDHKHCEHVDSSEINLVLSDFTVLKSVCVNDSLLDFTSLKKIFEQAHFINPM